MKVFAWRLAKEVLPTNVNKQNRHIVQLDTCEVCGNGAEDGFHAVIGCKHSWRSGLSLMPQYFSIRTGMGFAFTW